VYNLRTVMTFHQKVEEAAAFAEKMPETAAELYVNDASDNDLAAADRLPKYSLDAEFYELEAGRHVPPERVWSAWLCGDHLVAERREVLRQFAGGIDAAGRRVHRVDAARDGIVGDSPRARPRAPPRPIRPWQSPGRPMTWVEGMVRDVDAAGADAGHPRARA
jgi:ABC-type nitrate/sulfonate/bicarbonate transport system substrate-binding protein